MVIQKIKTLSFSILFLFVFTSCCKNLYFTDDDTFWVDLYEKQDLLIFKSNLGNLDSILIVDKIVYKADGKCNPLEVSSLSKSSARVTNTNSRSKWNQEDYFIQIEKQDKNKAVTPLIRLFNLEAGHENFTLQPYFIKTLNRQLENCYLFEPEKYTKLGYYPEKINKFYWDRKLGLVAYSNSKGEVWELFVKEKKL